MSDAPSPVVSAASFDAAAVVGRVAVALGTGDLLTGLGSALEVLVEATGADDAEVFLCEPEGRDALLTVWAGPDGAALVDRTRFEVGLGYPGIVTTTDEFLCNQGGLADDARFLRQDLVDAGICSFVAVPLPDVDGTLGSIHLMSRREEFPVEDVCTLLTRAAVPVGSAIRAGLAALRQSVDAVCGDLDQSGQPVRVLLESMKQVAGARYGTLALIDPVSGRPNRVVSTGPASLLCQHVESGDWKSCASTMSCHGFVADPGRRSWPEACRCGLPRRASSPCCLPLVANGRLFGLVVLDFGRNGTDYATGPLVPLLSMANQLAIRLRSGREGFAIPRGDDSTHGGATWEPEATELELRCLGPFVAFHRGRSIPAEAFTRRKALVLLKLLAIRAGAPVHRDVLIELLWPEVDPRQGANRLHGLVHDLRSVIEPQRTGHDWLYVRSRDGLYYLDVDAGVDIDVSRFRLLLRAAQHDECASDAEACDLLEQAVELYRGDLFADDPFATWCETERQELRRQYVEALERLARLHQAGGRVERALDASRRAVRAAPYREGLIVAELRLLMELGRTQEAQAAWDDHRRVLGDELATAPSEATRLLCQRLLGATC